MSDTNSSAIQPVAATDSINLASAAEAEQAKAEADMAASMAEAAIARNQTLQDAISSGVQQQKAQADGMKKAGKAQEQAGNVSAATGGVLTAAGGVIVGIAGTKMAVGGMNIALAGKLEAGGAAVETLEKANLGADSSPSDIAARAKELREGGEKLMQTGTEMLPAGTQLMSKGAQMLASGFAQKMMGQVQQDTARELSKMALKKMQELTKSKTLVAKEEKVLNQAIQDSMMFEQMLQMFEQMVDELGAEGDLTEEEFAHGMLEFDQNIQDGADSIANGGLMQVTGLTDEDGNDVGPQFFREAKDGGFEMVALKTDDSGNVLLNNDGRVMVDDSIEATKVEDQGLNDLLTNKFLFRDLVKNMADNMEIGSTSIDADGNESFTTESFDFTNQDHLYELQLATRRNSVHGTYTGKQIGPLKMREENGEIYLKQYDWFNEEDMSHEFSLTDIYGGSSFEQGSGNIDAMQDSFQHSDNARAQLGFNDGGLQLNRQITNNAEELTDALLNESEGFDWSNAPNKFVGNSAVQNTIAYMDLGEGYETYIPEKDLPQSA